MFIKRFNYWYLSSFLISILVALPIVTVFYGFFETTSDYFLLLKNTFLLKYISNSILLLAGVLLLTFLFVVGAAYCGSFYEFPGSNFLKWALILSFAIPSYIYAILLLLFLRIMVLPFQFLLIYLEHMNIIT